MSLIEAIEDLKRYVRENNVRIARCERCDSIAMDKPRGLCARCEDACKGADRVNGFEFRENWSLERKDREDESFEFRVLKARE